MEKLLSIFRDLKESRTTKAVDNFLTYHEIDKKFHLNADTYPKIAFNITKQEIDQLKQSKLLTQKFLIADTSRLDTFGKLLYALAWKNGDLIKIKHIFTGILSEPEEQAERAIVFNQFGRHLSDKSNEPIIDRHVLRAFGIYKFREDREKVEYFRKLSIVTKTERPLIKEYKKWLTTELTAELRQDPDYSYHVDKVLFAVGKYMKSKK